MERSTDDPRRVYPEREDTRLLLPFASASSDRMTVLDLGTGNGALALAAARAGATVVAVDRNPHALRAVRRAARAERLRVDAVRTDLARGLGRFDRIFANPPYLPTVPDERDPDRWENLALDGGPDGCRVTARIVGQLAGHLAPGGVAFLLVSSVQDPERLGRIRARWAAAGGQCRVVARRRLEGEVLAVWAMSRARTRAIRPGGRRAPRPRPGTAGRRRSRPDRRYGSNPAPAPGRTTVRGAASGRRRSPRGS